MHFNLVKVNYEVLRGRYLFEGGVYSDLSVNGVALT